MPSTEPDISGGCQCGAVRFRIDTPLEEPELCHCRMCQKAHGAPAVAWATVKMDGLYWTRGKPSYFRSSEHARRGFCGACGTPLIFDRDGDATIDIALSALDHPEEIAPVMQYGVETRMPWFVTAHLLPEELRPAPGKSFQHPDHDTLDWQGGA
jgi:hypothetical protein